MTKKEVAAHFGSSLDKDDYESALSLLHVDCSYDIGGNEILSGAKTICDSYEQNMIAGKKKMDSLEWGTCKIEPITSDTFYIHFTDYLGHKGVKHTHRCKQKVEVGDDMLIARIEHIHNQEETDKLNTFYSSVGIPTVGT